MPEEHVVAEAAGAWAATGRCRRGTQLALLGAHAFLRWRPPVSSLPPNACLSAARYVRAGVFGSRALLLRLTQAGARMTS